MCVCFRTLVKTVEKMRSEIAITDMDKYGAELEKARIIFTFI